MISEFQIVALIEQLEGKITQLNQQYDKALKTISRLETERDTLRKDLRKAESEAKKQEKKLQNAEKKSPKSKEIGKIVSNKLSVTDTNAELKQQLDEYIRHLEGCIAHWSSLS